MKSKWFIEYYKVHYREAGKDTYKFFKKHIVINAFFIIAMPIAGIFVGNKIFEPVNLNQITMNILTGLAGLGVLVTGVFFWNLLFYTRIRIFGSNLEKQQKHDYATDTYTEERKQRLKEGLAQLTSEEWAGLREISIQGGLVREEITSYLNRLGFEYTESMSLEFFPSVNSIISILDRDFLGKYTIKDEYKAILLEEQSHPKLAVTFVKGERPWFQEQPNSHSPYISNLTYSGELYTYRIGLMNLGSGKILNIQTKLIEIEPFPQELSVVPCHLHFMNDTKQPYDESNNLQMTKNAKSGLFVDVFVYFRAKDVHHLGVYHIVGNPGMIPIQSYEITIEISSGNGGDITKHFGFNPTRPNAKLCMDMID